MNLVQALYLNNAAEPFTDERVRQALCYAVDPQGVMDMISEGKGTAIGSSMFPAFGKIFYARAFRYVCCESGEGQRASEGSRI